MAFIDQTDQQEIGGHPVIELLGVTDDAIDYTKLNKLIDGYVLVTDGTTTKQRFAADDDGTLLTITYKQTNGGFTLITPAGNQPAHTDYQTDPKDPKTITPISVQSIHGYTPHTDNGELEPIDPDDLSKGYTLTPADPTKPTNVTYTADAKSVQVAMSTKMALNFSDIQSKPSKVLLIKPSIMAPKPSPDTF